MKRARALAKLFVGAGFLALLAGSERPANAALTSGETAQVNQYVGTAQPLNAERVRALIARPDLAAEESATALQVALGPLVFSDLRAVFLREVVFGGASVPSRSVLAVAVVRGVLARANQILVKYNRPEDLDAHPDSIAELTRIYAFVDSAIANTGPRRGIGVEPQTGISLQAYEDCATAVAAHIEHNPRWLKSDVPLTPLVTRVRAQLQLALADLMSPSATWRVDVADRLSLTGARRAFMIELGMLVLDSGKAGSGEIERIRGVLGRLPAARLDAEAIYFGPPTSSEGDAPVFHARGQVLMVKILSPAPVGVSPFGDEVDPGPTDAAASSLALELATVAVKRALDNRGDLRVQAERDVRAVAGDSKWLLGKPAKVTAEAALASALELLVTDAPRTLDLAFARFLSLHPESAAILSDALGVLAAFAPGVVTPQVGVSSAAGADGLAIALGKPRADTGATETTLLTGVRLAPNGPVTSFALSGHRWELTRGDSGAVTAVRRDGTPVTFAMLPTARVPVNDGISWNDAGRVFVRMQGRPRAGMASGARVRVVGMGEKGFDAIATPSPADDVVIETDLRAEGESGLVVRAAPVKEVFRGVSLVIIPSSPPRAVLRLSDDAGVEVDLTPTQELPLAAGYHVKLTVKGTKIEALIGAIVLKATLPPSVAHGDIGLRAKKGASLEAVGLSIRKVD